MPGLALIEITNFTPAIVALDALEKAAGVTLVQMELNDFNGIFLKIGGDPSSLRAAADAAKQTVEAMQGKINLTILNAPSDEALRAIMSKPEKSPLLNQSIVFDPHTSPAVGTTPAMSDKPFAIGLIETQGFTAVMEAIDTACKAANVTILGKEKLGGGYITIVIRGDVAAVRAAVDAAKPKVEGLGKLIAAHVIARPSESVLSLLPKV